MIGYFKDLDNNSWSVQIGEGDDELILGSHPVIISTNSDGIFSPIKSRTCTIKLVVNEPLYELYSSKAQGVKVTVKKGVTTIFIGYLTPNIYNQQFHYLNELELEAVEAFSTLKYFKYELSNNTDNLVTFGDLVRKARTLGGYSSYSVRTQLSTDDGTTFNNIKINELNFFEDEGDKEAWDYYKIIEEICKYLGLSLVFINDEMYFVNYSLMESVLTLRGENVSANDLSLDDTYNKITITANHYPINESLLNDNIFDNFETQLLFQGLYGQDYNDTLTYANHYADIYVKYGKTTTSNYKMNWYKGDYKNNNFNSITPNFNNLDFTQNIGAVPIRICTPNKGEASISWEDYILIGLGDYTIGETSSPEAATLRLYNTKKDFEIINYKSHLHFAPPKDTNTYIVITGKYGIIQYDNVRDRNTKELVELPFYVSDFETPKKSSFEISTKYGISINNELFCYSIKIGNKYYNSDTISWQDTLHINSMPKPVYPKDRISCNTFYSFINNVHYDDMIGFQGYKVLLPQNTSVNDEIEIKIYRPLFMFTKQDLSVDYADFMVYNCFENKDNCCAAFKDFDIKFVSVDKEGNFLENNNSNKDEEDTEYTNTIDESFVNDFSNVELLINTQNQHKQVSLASPFNQNGEYVTEINGKLQENNLVEMYSNHFNSPKRKINLTIEGYLNPTISYNYTWNDNDGSSGTFNNFIVDTQEWDCEYNTNNINLIEL